MNETNIVRNPNQNKIKFFTFFKREFKRAANFLFFDWLRSWPPCALTVVLFFLPTKTDHPVLFDFAQARSYAYFGSAQKALSSSEINFFLSPLMF